MLRFKQFINEVLNQAQRDKVNTWLPDKASGLIYSPKAEELSKHIIPEGRHHIVIPAVAHTMRAVHAHLDANGYTNHNYAQGTTTDKHGRVVSIGKALERTKADDQLKNDFANDDRENAEHLEKHDIVISRHPHHVAEGSTNEPWKSCAGLTASGRFCSYGQGAAARKLPEEIRQGTHVAYLVPKLKPDEEQDDSFNGAQNRIDQAVGRIYLKPHKSDSGHEVLIPENKVYQKKRKGQPEGKNLGFLRSLETFTNLYFPMKDGETYKKNNKVYDDDGTVNQPKFNTSDQSIDKLKTSDDPRVRSTLRTSKNLNSKQLHDLIDYYNDTTHDRGAMEELAENPNLKKDHIDKLLSRDILTVNTRLAMKPNLHKNHVEHLINKNSDAINQMLGMNTNKKLLSNDHIHRIIDNALDTENRIIEKGKSRNWNPNEIDNVFSNTRSRENLISMLNHHNVDPSHVDKILQSNDPIVHTRILDNHLHHLTNDHLQSIIDKWKDKDLSHLNHWHNPHLQATNKLNSRLHKDEITESVSDDPLKWKYKNDDVDTIKKTGKNLGSFNHSFKTYTMFKDPSPSYNKDGYGFIHVIDDEDNVVGDIFWGRREEDGKQEAAVEVHPKHRRRKIATHLYNKVEELTGEKLHPAPDHTKDAAAFWANRINSSK